MTFTTRHLKKPVSYTALSGTMERVHNSAVTRLEKCNTTISKRTLLHYAQYNKAGKSPKQGSDGGFSPDVFKIMVQADKTYVGINRINDETKVNDYFFVEKGA